ncbi:MAG: type II secretion system protein [Candidatus Eisenbacteria bacterium]|nr:type II secretion system protein [Candidatus Eisenbacteria bacterium]
MGREALHGDLRGRPRRAGEGGFSLVEIMIAASLLLIAFFGITRYFVGGRRQLDYEENRRRATTVAQMRLDGLRRDYSYDDLPLVHGVDTTFVLENRSYRVAHAVSADSPETGATRVRVAVSWREKVSGSDVTRSLETTTVFGRGLP